MLYVPLVSRQGLGKIVLIGLMYTLLVCADVYGEKVNLEIVFPSMPAMGELRRRVTEVLTWEGEAKRPTNYPRVEFTISRLLVYDDVLLSWEDLVSVTQLHEYDQLYVFQPQSQYHSDEQKDLPPPRAMTHGTSRLQSTSHPSDAEKVHVVFSQLDTNRDSFISIGELRQGLHVHRVEFNEANVGDLSRCPDRSRLSLTEFAEFARKYPNSLEALYCQGDVPKAGGDWGRRLQYYRTREQELTEELERVRSMSLSLEGRVGDLQRDAVPTYNPSHERDRALNAQEESLVRKERDVELHREALRRSEEEYVRLSRAFDQAAAESRSHRRSHPLP